MWGLFGEEQRASIFHASTAVSQAATPALSSRVMCWRNPVQIDVYHAITHGVQIDASFATTRGVLVHEAEVRGFCGWRT
jgi:hypothetical protein